MALRNLFLVVSKSWGRDKPSPGQLSSLALGMGVVVTDGDVEGPLIGWTPSHDASWPYKHASVFRTMEDSRVRRRHNTGRRKR